MEAIYRWFWSQVKCSRSDLQRWWTLEKGNSTVRKKARVNHSSGTMVAACGHDAVGNTCGVSFLKVTRGVAFDNTTLLWISVPSLSTTPFAVQSEPTRMCSTSCQQAQWMLVKHSFKVNRNRDNNFRAKIPSQWKCLHRRIEQSWQGPETLHPFLPPHIPMHLSPSPAPPSHGVGAHTFNARP